MSITRKASMRLAIVFAAVTLTATAALAAAGDVSDASQFPLAATPIRELGFCADSAAFDGTNYLVGINGYGGNPSLVAAQLVSLTGEPVGERIDVGWYGGTPHVAFDGVNFLLTWDGCPNNSACASGYTISGQFISKTGASVGSPFRIGQSSGHAETGLQNIVFDGTNYFVVWDAMPEPDGCDDKYGQFVTPAGTLLGSPIKINSIGCGGTPVSLAFDGTNILVSWHSEWDVSGNQNVCLTPSDCYSASTWGQFVTKSSNEASGSLLRSNFLISESSVRRSPAATAFDGTNYLILLPQETTRPDACPPTGCDSDLYGQFVSKSGTPVGSLITISNTAGNQYFPIPTFDGTNYLITWTDGLGGPASSVAAKGRLLNPAGSFTGPEFTLFSATAGGRVPFITGSGGFNGGRYFLLPNWGTPGNDPIDVDAYSDADIYGAFIDRNTIPRTSFTDVASDNIFTGYIAAIANAGITKGCGSGNYCPSDNVTRGQMAAFIERSLHGEDFTYPVTPYFGDVPSTNTYFKYVQRLKSDGITAVTGTYDVEGHVTRGQMAAFLVRTKFGENFTYTENPYFSDVPIDHMFFKYVQKLKDAGITAVNGIYNVTSNVTRDQMAAFLARAFLNMP